MRAADSCQDDEMITQSRLKELLRYEPETGKFFWLANKGRGKPTKAAGCIGGKGYRRIGIDDADYSTSRLVWLYVYGKFPDDECDHRDGNRDNNCLTNLREATHSQNLQNRRKAQARSKTGFLGVWKKRTKFAAGIRFCGKTIHLGSFATPEEAYASYLAKKREIHAFCTI